ncbi:porin [Pseudoxanthomonas composti]|uniref:Porin n=1 Tax=Pseudoxanthomonas composti TaxID=2137479 RepID=A0A4Q1JXL8_9GAMM|nr:porin [Pseudoxanthomonas composti]
MRNLRACLQLGVLPLALMSGHAMAANGSFDNWPTKSMLTDSIEGAITGNMAWDSDRFSGDDRLADESGWRRNEFGATLKKKGVWDAMVYYDFQSDLWLDVFVRFETKAWFGRDLGKIRVGYIKTPLGLDGLTASRAGSFMELGLPTQVVFEGRRTGVEWSYEQPRFLLTAGAYGGKDLQGDNPGQTFAARGVWTPIKAEGNVLHLGIAGSRENPEGFTDGRGVYRPPSTRLRARPEAGLTDVRLVDSGTLTYVDHINRTGLEGLWIHGPVSVQAEALRANVTRNAGLPEFTAQGEYAYVSWLLTGESRPYAGGVAANPKPSHDFGAVELVARWSHLDLDDGPIYGGREHDLTVGANWYLTQHFKFQANYVHADASRNHVHTTPDAVEVRAQVMF